VLLAFIALLASYIPAPRAARIDPMVRCAAIKLRSPAEK